MEVKNFTAANDTPVTVFTLEGGTELKLGALLVMLPTRTEVAIVGKALDRQQIIETIFGSGGKNAAANLKAFEQLVTREIDGEEKAVLITYGATGQRKEKILDPVDLSPDVTVAEGIETGETNPGDFVPPAENSKLGGESNETGNETGAGADSGAANEEEKPVTETQTPAE